RYYLIQLIKSERSMSNPVQAKHYKFNPIKLDQVIFHNGEFGTVKCEGGILSNLPIQHKDFITITERAFVEITNLDPKDFGAGEVNADYLIFHIIRGDKNY